MIVIDQTHAKIGYDASLEFRYFQLKKKILSFLENCQEVLVSLSEKWEWNKSKEKKKILSVTELRTELDTTGSLFYFDQSKCLKTNLFFLLLFKLRIKVKKAKNPQRKQRAVILEFTTLLDKVFTAHMHLIFCALPFFDKCFDIMILILKLLYL